MHSWSACRACGGEDTPTNTDIEALVHSDGSLYAVIAGNGPNPGTAGELVVYQLQLQDGRWSKVLALGVAPCARQQSCVVLLGECLIVSGGVSAAAGDQKLLLDDLWCLNLRTKQWQAITAMCTIDAARASHSAAVLGGSVMIVGGWHQRWPAPLKGIRLQKQYLRPEDSAGPSPFCKKRVASQTPRPVVNTELRCLLSRSRADRGNKFTDVVLVSSEGVEFPAHKVVLAAQSDVFEAMLGGNMQVWLTWVCLNCSITGSTCCVGA